MFVLGLSVFVLITVFCMVLGGDVSIFIDLPSFLLIVPSLFFAIASTSFQDLNTALSILFKSRNNVEDLQFKNAIRVWDVLGESAMWLGWFGFVMGLVTVASNITPEQFINDIGPFLAVCALTVFYALAVKILCYFFKKRTEYLMQVAVMKAI